MHVIYFDPHHYGAIFMKSFIVFIMMIALYTNNLKTCDKNDFSITAEDMETIDLSFFDRYSFESSNKHAAHTHEQSSSQESSVQSKDEYEPCCFTNWLCNENKTEEYSCCCATAIAPCALLGFCTWIPEYIHHKNEQTDDNHGVLKFLNLNCCCAQETQISSCTAFKFLPCFCLCLPCVYADHIILVNKKSRQDS